MGHAHKAEIVGFEHRAHGFIVAFLDGGPAILKATREAMDAGVAVAPYDTGDGFPGKIGKDYVDRAADLAMACSKLRR